MSSKQLIDISSKKSGIERLLSNFIRRPFFLDGVFIASMEGFLQSLKFSNIAEQDKMCSRVGYQAFKLGQEGNSWKETQVLYWRGQEIGRYTDAYASLLVRVYDAQFQQNEDFRDLLRSTVGSELRHTMGKNDPSQSVLTEFEYIAQLNRLRFLSLQSE